MKKKMHVRYIIIFCLLLKYAYVSFNVTIYLLKKTPSVQKTKNDSNLRA